MNARLLESRRRHEVEPEAVLDLLAQSETPALATDGQGHVVFWNRAAERLFGRTSSQVLGRRCFDVTGGRDVFGNRFCHENCAVLCMTRKRESVRAFEMAVQNAPRPEQLSVTVMRLPGSDPGHTLVHLMQPIDAQEGLTPSGRPEGAAWRFALADAQPLDGGFSPVDASRRRRPARRPRRPAGPGCAFRRHSIRRRFR
jgi:PAS domain S-box-containing protein